jgi:hypothetical protein
MLEAIHKTFVKVSHKTERLRSFLGLENFYRKFIKRFSQLEKPFLDLSKKELTILQVGGTISSYGAFRIFYFSH